MDTKGFLCNVCICVYVSPLYSADGDTLQVNSEDEVCVLLEVSWVATVSWKWNLLLIDLTKLSVELFYISISAV